VLLRGGFVVTATDVGIEKHPTLHDIFSRKPCGRNCCERRAVRVLREGWGTRKSKGEMPG
jgi:hypothetical protein